MGHSLAHASPEQPERRSRPSGRMCVLKLFNVVLGLMAVAAVLIAQDGLAASAGSDPDLTTGTTPQINAPLKNGAPLVLAQRQQTRSVVPRQRPKAPWANMVKSRPQRVRTIERRSAEGYHYRASWNRGLAAWRRQDYANAAGRFAHIARLKNAPSSTAAAAAFWAARAYLQDRKPEKVTEFLTEAARHPQHFYGLVARHILGMALPFSWAANTADEEAARALERTRLGQRVVALIERGETKAAEQALLKAADAPGGAHAHGAMIMAERSGFAHLALRLRNRLYPRDGGPYAASYPVPHWRPRGGFTEDPALIYALARQESRFNPRAISSVGARGVMQVMPATARVVDRRSEDKHLNWRRLSDPEINLAIGQRYIEILLHEEQVSNDLLSLAVAWNAGPNTLRKWRAGGATSTEDPLLFIELIPFQQTRVFVQHVLANYWIYQNRFGLASPSLDAVARGQWPTYIRTERNDRTLAQRDE